LFVAAATDRALVQALPEVQAQAEAAVLYMRPKLLEARVDLKHRSYLLAVFGEDLGHVLSLTMHTLLPIHGLWVPKYMN
jgi:hypothetical protein